MSDHLSFYYLNLFEQQSSNIQSFHFTKPLFVSDLSNTNKSEVIMGKFIFLIGKILFFLFKKNSVSMFFQSLIKQLSFNINFLDFFHFSRKIQFDCQSFCCCCYYYYFEGKFVFSNNFLFLIVKDLQLFFTTKVADFNFC